MQYVFINNIKNILTMAAKGEDGKAFNLQSIVTTHSSHITAESTFDDIKYFTKLSGSNCVIAKNLKDLAKIYGTETKQYDFLKQYLNISRAELFFADKAVLIEGDTERILLPTLMKKLDGEDKNGLPLLSQNISVVEVGAHAQTFEKFIEFIGLKALIITDLDSVGDDNKACRVKDGKSYSNSALSFFFDSATLDDLKKRTIKEKAFKKDKAKWICSEAGNICLVYQTDEGGYNGRSFEDAFISINRKFIEDDIADFKGLKNREYFKDKAKDSYELAQDCISKKTHFALDILFHSNEKFNNWSIPAYIKEGLLWLKQN